ncbi:transcription factor bHLH104-like protein [Cinnamomum micranthum f. kanehirae]|uniref:Transcription factor bHLH104-like protein n=1 Tax=Cinnamomum micranthum f. kanehirae TaxID=337451 RepID=A0A3S3QWF0_9MAGN|nr:transcription factor bHLH104-like protein [Cinnamomum micranthum f. kanehirae]
MDSFQDNGWDLLDYNNIIQDNLCWSNQSSGVEFNASFAGSLSQENASARKRARNESCSRPSSKACREKMRRDKMNDRFSDLCSILEPGRPVKTDKSAILSDAIRVLNQLRTEAKDLKEANEKLQEDIKVLKAEKNELREEKLRLKADKERMEQQVKAMTVLPVGLVPPHPAVYPTGVNKMMAFHGYGGVPMWQFLSPAALDTSQDTVLRPPAA